MTTNALNTDQIVDEQQSKKHWTRSETLALAQQSCTYCYGLGLRPGRSGASTPCNCVFRAIFRACYTHFRDCAAKEKYVSRVTLEANPGGRRKSVWGLKNEEFVADFCLVSERALSRYEHRIFRYHYLLGADWKLCTRKLNIDRGTFFHEIYRIEQKLGRIFRELEPYALFPVDEYMNGTGNYDKAIAAVLSPFEVDSDDEEEAPAQPIDAKQGRVSAIRTKKLLKFPIRRAA